MSIHCLKLNDIMRSAAILYYPFILDRYYLLNTTSSHNWDNSARKYSLIQPGFLTKNTEIIIYQ